MSCYRFRQWDCKCTRSNIHRLGKPFLIALETAAEKIRNPCSHAKKIRIRNLRFRKIHFRERFRKAPFWPRVFKKLRIRSDTCDRFYVSGVKKLRFRKDPGTCARSLSFSPLEGRWVHTFCCQKRCALRNSSRSSLRLLLSNGVPGDRQPKQTFEFPAAPSFFSSKKWIKLIPKTIGNRKRDCAWGCTRRINTTSENLQIEKHKSVRWAERKPSWFVLFDLQIFWGGVYPPSATSRTISFSISTTSSFWY